MRYSFDQEPFQKAPALFRHGPWALVVVSIVLTVAVLFAIYSKNEMNRASEYHKALAALKHLAAVSHQSFESLLPANHADEFEPSDGSFSTERLASPADMSSYQLAAQGNPQSVPARRLSGKALPSGVIDELQRHAGLDAAVQVFEANAQRYVAFYEVSHDATVARVIRQEYLLARALRMLGNSGASLAIVHPDAVVVDTGDAAQARHSGVRTVTDAMATAVDFSSRRPLVVESGHDGYTYVVAIPEGVALDEFSGRWRDTWIVAGGALAAWVAVALYFAMALRGFKRTEAYLRGLATTDALTRLPNRRSFHSLLRKTIRAGKGCALFFLDLDNFKDINDSLGHPVGDEMLRHVAASLSRGLPAGGKLCRLAGDEFTIILPGISTPEDARAAGEALLVHLRSVFHADGIDIEPRASMGAALAGTHAGEGVVLMRFADIALFKAKHDGGNRCVVYDPSMHSMGLERQLFIRGIERGLSQGEFFLDYQPKYHLATGALTGHEALVRWQHPVRGLVPPGQFIEAMEQGGLIQELGSYVLRRAVQQIRAWHDEGRGWHKVAINVSRHQLRDTTFVSEVREMLAVHQVPARCLQLEITESTLAENTEIMRARIAGLHELGCSIALDDFGTGYSSLSVLSEFAIDVLKVDRSFITQLSTDQGLSICRAIVRLGHSLGMPVVAEGIETLEQAQILAQLDCNEVQGYYFAKPMAPELAVAALRVEPVTVMPADENWADAVGRAKGAVALSGSDNDGYELFRMLDDEPESSGESHSRAG